MRSLICVTIVSAQPGDSRPYVAHVQSGRQYESAHVAHRWSATGHVAVRAAAGHASAADSPAANGAAADGRPTARRHSANDGRTTSDGQFTDGVRATAAVGQYTEYAQQHGQPVDDQSDAG